MADMVALAVKSAVKLYNVITLARENKGKAEKLKYRLTCIERQLSLPDPRSSSAITTPLLPNVLERISHEFAKLGSDIDEIVKLAKEPHPREPSRASSVPLTGPSSPRPLTKCLKPQRFTTANNIDAKLTIALYEAANLQTRLENLHLVSSQHDAFISKLEELHRNDTLALTRGPELSPDAGAVLEDVRKLLAHLIVLHKGERRSSAAADSHDTPSRISASSSSQPFSSAPGIDADADAAEQNVLALLARVPAEARTLLECAARPGTPQAEVEGALRRAGVLWTAWEIDEERVHTKVDRPFGSRPLGTGASVAVYKGYLRIESGGNDSDEKSERGNGESDGSSLPVAVKRVELDDKRGMHSSADVSREALLHMVMAHPCVVRVHGVVWKRDGGGEGESSAALIVMELMTHSVRSALRKGLLGEADTRRRVLTDAACALAHLHSRGVVHRDVKEENVLVNFDEQGRMCSRAKLCDFGASRKVRDERATRQTRMSETAVAGTELYLPPEVGAVGSRCRTRSSWDVWSFGVMVCATGGPWRREGVCRLRRSERVWGRSAKGCSMGEKDCERSYERSGQGVSDGSSGETTKNGEGAGCSTREGGGENVARDIPAERSGSRSYPALR